MKTTKQIIWETKSEMYNRIWNAMSDAFEEYEGVLDKKTELCFQVLPSLKNLERLERN